MLGSYRLLYIDEAQKIPEIGLKLKLMIDEIEGLKIIISGSSSFDIHKDEGEPLTGRKYSCNLYALAESEYKQIENSISKIDMISERLKYQEYNRIASNNYFWRTYEKQEVDWVEERSGALFGYGFKWKENKVKVPTQWKSAYPEASFEVINMNNFQDWLK